MHMIKLYQAHDRRNTDHTHCSSRDRNHILHAAHTQHLQQDLRKRTCTHAHH